MTVLSSDRLAARISGAYSVAENTGCWEWTRSINNKGYGRFKIGPGKYFTAHRASYIVHKGPIPDGLFVCHRCDNRRCINPDHLFVGTNADNMADCAKKGRNKGHLNAGANNGSAILSEEDVMAILASKEKQQALADKYGVTQPAISNLKSGRSWRIVHERKIDGK